MKRSLLILAIFHALSSFAQNWGRNTESAFVNEALDVEVDGNGNIYTTGYITGETAFDVTVVQPSAAGNGDIYVAKYSQSGSLAWIKQFGGNFSDRAYDLCIDQANNIIITGQFYGSVAFGATTLVSASNSKDIFIAKLDPTGTVLWARKEGGSSSENAYGITTDGQNNVILTGQFEGTSTIAGSTFTSVTDPSTNLPSYDLFISKYDSNGNPMWVKNGSAEYEDRGLAVHTDANNNIFMTGQFSDTLLLDGQTVNNNGYNVGFLAKFSPSGTLLWLNTLRAGVVMPYDLEVNSANEVVVIGDFLGTLQYTDALGINQISNPFTKQIFAIKTNNDGNYMWHQSLGSDNSLSARALAVDNAKDIFITGYFSCGLSELQVTQSAIFNSVGYKDAYLWKIGNNGASLFVNQFGGKKNDIGHGVAILNSIDPIICGSYTEDLNIPWNNLGMYQISPAYFDLIPAVGGADPAHVFLWGDESENSFVTSAVHSLTPTYNFFENQPVDSLYGNIDPDLDTAHFCVQGAMQYDAHTYDHYGPRYSYLWNTGDTTVGISTALSGTYNVQVERQDGCSMGGDTIVAIIHQLPILPTMSDNLGIAVNAPGSSYASYTMCYPDSVQTWFNNLDTSYTFSVGTSPPNLYSDTLPHFYAQGGTHQVQISDAYCDNIGWFTLTMEYPNTPEIVPYIMMQNNGFYSDSITICEGEFVRFDLLDSLENPTAIFAQYPSDTIVQYDWASWPVLNGSELGYYFQTYPTTSGWYTILYDGIFGYDNTCGLDTIQRSAVDSFYIEVLPTPSATTTILGDNLLCPGGSIYLSLTNVIPGLAWSGSGIVWTSAAGDSAQVTLAGSYEYSGTYVDTTNGCSSFLSFSHLILEKVAPVISTDPSDAIICPNDSVLMSVNDIFVSYDWTGPMGSGLSTTYQHSDDEQGFYYVTVEDIDGCMLTSAPLEIREYTSPYLAAEPTNVICENESVNLLAIFEGNGQAQWSAPIVSSLSQLTVNQPGWYYCELQHCGITVFDSIQVIDGSFSASLTLSDSVLCYGYAAIISAPAGLSSYNWSNGQSGVTSILVTTAGDYWATVMNNYGCMQETDTVTLSYVSGSEPPIIADLSGCAGDTITIQNAGALPTNWFSVDTTLISSGYQLMLNNVSANTIILASYGAIGSCPASYDDIVISITDSVPNYPISGTTILCPESASSFSVGINGEDVEWFVNGVSLGSGPSISFPAGMLNDGDVLSAEISNVCFTSTVSANITVLPSPIASIGSDTLSICYDGDLSIEMTQAFTNVDWSGDFGSSNDIQFDLYTIYYNGMVYGYAYDANGCVSNTDSVFVSVADGGVYIDNALGTICAGDSINWLAVSVLDSIVWYTPAGAIYDSTFSIVANGANSGMYTAFAYDNLGCEYADSVELIVNDNPTFTIPSDTVLCLNTYLNFVNFPDSNAYMWNGSPVLDSMSIGQNQWLYIVATSPAGCTTEDSVFVQTVDCNAALTNVFTPNGDGINDYFMINLVDIYPNNSLIIVSRWGNVIYDVDRYDNSYDGSDVEDGTYFYYFYPEGREKSETVIQGHVTIFH